MAGAPKADKGGHTHAIHRSNRSITEQTYPCLLNVTDSLFRKWKGGRSNPSLRNAGPIRDGSCSRQLVLVFTLFILMKFDFMKGRSCCPPHSNQKSTSYCVHRTIKNGQWRAPKKTKRTTSGLQSKVNNIIKRVGVCVLLLLLLSFHPAIEGAREALCK